MAGPKRGLVSAPGGGNGDDGEHDAFDNLHGAGHSVLALLFMFAEAMGHLNVGTSSFRHCDVSLAATPLYAGWATPSAGLKPCPFKSDSRDHYYISCFT